MTNEQKDNLTGLCKIEIKRWEAASESNPNMRYMVELMELALAALTAQPVKLPPGKLMQVAFETDPVNADMYLCISRDGAVNAIRVAGYEVQE